MILKNRLYRSLYDAATMNDISWAFYHGLYHAVTTLHALGYVGTDDENCPRSDPSPKAPMVLHPGDAVVEWYRHKDIFGGISVRILQHEDLATEVHDMCDILLGWTDPPTKTFRWAFQDRLVLTVPVAEPASIVLWDILVNVPETAHPVWLTVGDITLRNEIRSAIRNNTLEFPEMRDVLDDVLAAARRKAFWDASREDFIKTTWHPSRVFRWCLDTEEVADFEDHP